MTAISDSPDLYPSISNLLHSSAMAQLDSPNNEAACNYAFALAMTAHLAEVESRFLALPAEDFQSLEQTLWAQDMATNFHLVREFGLQRLSDYYRKEDLAINCPQGQYRLSLTYAMESQLLGPRVKVLNTISTDQILAKVDEPAQFTGVLLYTNQLRRKLYLILANATKVVVGPTVEDSKVFLSISYVLGEYLAKIAASLSEQLDIGALAMLIDAIVAHFRQETSAPTCDFQTVFNVFKAMLASQLEVSGANVDEQEATVELVRRLREQGNNLMHITSYPQAIKVYTEAISLCDWTCSNNIPQLYTNRAVAFIGVNCFPEAVSDLNSALRYDRTFSPAWSQLGYCQLNLGSGFLALQCFHTALRTVAGEIYPENFPEDHELRTKYTENKIKTVVPQFVQKLVQSIILSEKRANQQLHSTESLREITARTRAILARLRAAAAPEDMNYFAYALENAFETFRSAASRANRSRPSILTPDIAQDIMAGSNMEATAVTILSPISFPAPSLNSRRSNNAATGANNPPAAGTDDGPVPPGPGEEAPRGEGATEPPVTINFEEDGLRNILNNLGEALGGMVQTQTQDFFGVPNAQGPQETTATPATAPADAPTGTDVANVPLAPASASSDSMSSSTSGTSPTRETGSPAAADATSAQTIGTTVPSATPITFIRSLVDGQETTNSQTAADFRNSIHSFLPDIRGNLGGIISLALRHHLDTARNHQVARPNNSNPSTGSSPSGSNVISTHHRSHGSQQQDSPTSELTAVSHNTDPQSGFGGPTHLQNDPDSEMPDAPDLD